jgi:hypothetical protein
MAMTNDEPKVRRTLHVKFTLPGGDPQQLLNMMQAAAPFYQAFGGVSTKLLQHADNPGRFIQVIEYETPAAFEQGRQQIASDTNVQAYVQAIRTFVPGAVEVDIYRDVGGEVEKGAQAGS